jgi:hypothetical protein
MFASVFRNTFTITDTPLAVMGPSTYPVSGIGLPLSSQYGRKDKKSHLTIRVPHPVSAQYDASLPSDSYCSQQDRKGSWTASSSFIESPHSDGFDAPSLVSGSSLVSASPLRTSPSNAVRPTNVLHREPATPIYNSAAPHSSQPGSVGSTGSDGHALALVAEALTRKLAHVRQNLTHERKQHSQKLSERKRTIDLTKDRLLKAYNEIQEVKAKDVSLIVNRVADRFTHLPQDACNKVTKNLEADVRHLHQELDSQREEYSRLEKESRAKICELIPFVLVTNIQLAFSGAGGSPG